jgi:hypothetical protein
LKIASSQSCALHEALLEAMQKKKNNMVTPQEAQLHHIPRYLISDGQHCDMFSLPLKKVSRVCQQSYKHSCVLVK